MNFERQTRLHLDANITLDVDYESADKLIEWSTVATILERVEYSLASPSPVASFCRSEHYIRRLILSFLWCQCLPLDL